MNARAAILALVLACGALFVPPAEAQNSANLEALVRGNTQFAFDLYRQVATAGGNPGGNLFFSPHSVATALAVTCAGARNKTAQQIASVLHAPLEGAEYHRAFGELQAKLNGVQNSGTAELRIANSLWPQARYPLLQAYLRLARESFGTEITPVDYAARGAVAQRAINEWVAGKTAGRITDILADAPDPVTRLVLASAVYFKGAWLSRFDASDTTTAPFHRTGTDPVEVPTMHQTGGFRCAEDQIAQVLEMPYLGGELSMLVVLPREVDGLPVVEESLTAQALELWRKSSSSSRVEVHFPRFRMTSRYDLTGILAAMGMPDAFVAGRADFSGIDGIPAWLYIGSAVHQSWVEVSEEGTEAAAATVGGGCFPAGTEVLSADGPRPIEAIEPGTRVYACDLASGRWVWASVRQRQARPYQGDMITIRAGRSEARATGNHPFYVLRCDGLTQRPAPQDVPPEELDAAGEGRWVEARDLRVGDVLKRSRGGSRGPGLTVTALSVRQASAQVYNLEVEGHHNYSVSAEGILVHNKGSAEPQLRVFRADHPFLFLIRENRTGSILFMGRVTDPRS